MYVVPICFTSYFDFFLIVHTISVQTLYSICCLPTAARGRGKLAFFELFSLLYDLDFDDSVKLRTGFGRLIQTTRV